MRKNPHLIWLVLNPAFSAQEATWSITSGILYKTECHHCVGFVYLLRMHCVLHPLYESEVAKLKLMQQKLCE
jgi:hypothetical protein